MVDFRLFETKFELEFELDDPKFELEFNTRANSFEDWLSFQKAKDNVSDPLILELLLGLHQKIDNLTNLIKSGEQSQNKLKFVKFASKIGYEGFAFDEDCLEIGKIYFARICVDSFFLKTICVYFEAVDSKTAKITKINPRSEKQWSHFVARSEMLSIRKAKYDK